MEVFWTLLGLVALVHGQNHGDTNSGVSCFSCRGDKWELLSFPSCLTQSQTTCSPGQSCRFHYSQTWNHMPTVSCSASCPYSSQPSVGCQLGGATTGRGNCDACCNDNACVAQMTSNLLKASPLMCPDHCSINHLKDCSTEAKKCDDDEFCQLKVINHRTVVGSCKPKTELSTCEQNNVKEACPSDVLTHSFILPRDCYLDCCESNECIQQKLNGPIQDIPVYTTVATTVPTTPATTTASPSLYGALEKECRDHLEPGACTSLRDDQNLCQSSGQGLHLDLCPETCGVCQAIQEANCHDVVLDGECSGLIDGKDICHDPLAIYTCPRSCNLCDILVEKKLAEILANRAQGVETATTTPATTTERPTTATTTPAPTTERPTTPTTTTDRPTTATTTPARTTVRSTAPVVATAKPTIASTTPAV